MKPKPKILRVTLIAILLLATVSLLLLSALAETFTEGKQVPPATESLKTGEFVWEPERSPGGPVLIVVSKPEQVAYVYRNGIRIARSSVSTGRPGHPTPVGVFDILEKERDHVSTIYKGAEMPWMERLTWNGIAMHAGDLPGYPDSHGCVRLSPANATTLYTLVKETGLENVQVVLSGVTKGGEGARVASPSNRDQDVYPPWFDRGYYQQQRPQKRRGLFGRRWFQDGPQGYYQPRYAPRDRGY